MKRTVTGWVDPDIWKHYDAFVLNQKLNVFCRKGSVSYIWVNTVGTFVGQVAESV
jgi:hypothetical protein